jgi:hypothetical protein
VTGRRKIRTVMASAVLACGALCATAPSALAAPDARSTEPRPTGTASVQTGTGELTAASGWHHLWGPASVWTRRFWRSKNFKVHHKVVGINFRCWRWRAASEMWASIDGTNGQVRAKSRNMTCDGHWKTLIWRGAHAGWSYFVGLHVDATQKTLLQVKAYDHG